MFSSHTFRRHRLRYKQKIKAKTTDQVFEITKTRNLLTQSIRQYYDCRRVYIPGLTLVDHGEDNDKLVSQPEALKLWVPSQLPAENRSSWCLPGIPDLELHFRYAQADDTLSDLRRHIRLLQLARDQNAKHTKSTSATTRSQGILDGFRGKINRLASQYRSARQALLALDPAQELAPNWLKYFLPLNDCDLRPPIRDETQPSEGRTQYSWIWIVPHPLPLLSMLTTLPCNQKPSTPAPAPSPVTQTPSTVDGAISDADSQDFHRVHWSKCQARAERYEEEVLLTVEEMGRTLRYFGWKRDQWLSLIPQHENSSSPPDVHDGLRAYACQQSHVYDELITLFITHWRTYLSSHSLGSPWLGEYIARINPAAVRPSRGRRKVDDSSAPITDKIPVPFELPIDPNPLVDAPLDSGSDDGSEGDDEEEVVNCMDAEDMFADD